MQSIRRPYGVAYCGRLFSKYVFAVVVPCIKHAYLFLAFKGIGGVATSLGCLLFAIINPDTTYWAFGLPASILAVLGADFVFSAGTLFISHIALSHEQSVAGAQFITMTQVNSPFLSNKLALLNDLSPWKLGTAFGVTTTTVVYNLVSVKLDPGRDVIVAYRAAQWTGCAFGGIGG